MTTQLPDHPTPPSAASSANTAAAAPMTATSFDQLHSELERLRSRARVEIARQLSEARAFGAGSNNDEYHAVREEQLVLEARSPRSRKPSTGRSSGTTTTRTAAW